MNRISRGLTLLELVVVLAVLAVLAMVAVPLVGTLNENGKATVAEQTLLQLRETICGCKAMPGYCCDVGETPRTTADLLRTPAHLATELQTFDPISKRGWNGPYLLHGGTSYLLDLDDNFTADYGQNGDPAVADPWGRAIVVQRPGVVDPANPERCVRLVSAGPNGTLDTPPTPEYPSRASCVDDVVLYLKSTDLRP